MANEKYEFNLNNTVFVKLNEKGFLHWQNEYNKHLPETVKRPISYFRERKDEEGFVSFQFWDFMSIFGNSILVIEPPFFSTNIRLYKRDLKEIKTS